VGILRKFKLTPAKRQNIYLEQNIHPQWQSHKKNSKNFKVLILVGKKMI